MSENDQENGGGGGLRKQLEDALARIQDLEGQITQSHEAQRELAFLKAGVDTESGVGKLLAKTYDGDLDPEAVATYAKEYGIEVGARTEETPRREQPDPTQQRMDSLRAQSTPEGVGQRMNVKDFLSLNQSDPVAARAAFESGAVDLPPHIAQQLNDNGRNVPA